MASCCDDKHSRSGNDAKRRDLIRQLQPLIDAEMAAISSAAAAARSHQPGTVVLDRAESARDAPIPARRSVTWSDSSREVARDRTPSPDRAAVAVSEKSPTTGHAAQHRHAEVGSLLHESNRDGVEDEVFYNAMAGAHHWILGNVS